MPASIASSDDGEFESFLVDVDQLQAHGIGAAEITKLKQNGFHTVAEVQAVTSRVLLKIKGFSDARVEKVKDAVRKCLEVYGEYRCGKTQLAHTLCVMAQLPKDQGGANGKVAYIDTEGTFRPERIQQIAERFHMDPELAIENITQARAWNSEHQHELLNNLSEMFATGQFRLLIVDSICALYRVDYTGRGELNERQQKLGQHLDRLKTISEVFNITVFMTNQVQSDPGASALFATDGRKPIGGHVLAHASTTRVLLRKGRGEERVAKIQDSPDCPEREATYIITTGGIDDPDKA